MAVGGKNLRRNCVLELRRFCAASLLFLLPFAKPGLAHPHVFVDGGVDFAFDGAGRLAALHVTWLYDEFETLYLLSSVGLSLNSEGNLSEADRQRLLGELTVWARDFDGSVHVEKGDDPIPLAAPSALDAKLVDGRLVYTFTRNLETLTDITQSSIELAFYEATYFYAFAVTRSPQLLNSRDRCTAEVISYDPDAADAALQTELAKLGREETPTMANVGSLFADRIVVQCE